MDIRTHRIGEIINKVLVDPWPVEGSPDKADGVGKNEERLWAWWGWGRKGPKPGQPDGDEDDDGGDDWEKHGGVPKPKAEKDCTDCYKW